jgi:hypothetical protein
LNKARIQPEAMMPDKAVVFNVHESPKGAFATEVKFE